MADCLTVLMKQHQDDLRGRAVLLGVTLYNAAHESHCAQTRKNHLDLRITCTVQQKTMRRGNAPHPNHTQGMLNSIHGVPQSGVGHNTERASKKHQHRHLLFVHPAENVEISLTLSLLHGMASAKTPCEKLRSSRVHRLLSELAATDVGTENERDWAQLTLWLPSAELRQRYRQTWQEAEVFGVVVVICRVAAVLARGLKPCLDAAAGVVDASDMQSGVNVTGRVRREGLPSAVHAPRAR